MFGQCHLRHILANLIKQSHNINKAERFFNHMAHSKSLRSIFSTSFPDMPNFSKKRLSITSGMSIDRESGLPERIMTEHASSNIFVFMTLCFSAKLTSNRIKSKAQNEKQQEKPPIISLFYNFFSFLIGFSCYSSDFLVYTTYVYQILLSKS